MLLPAHRSHDDCESPEVAGLDDQGVTLEEREDVLLQVPQRIDGERPHAAVRALRSETTAGEQ